MNIFINKRILPENNLNRLKEKMIPKYITIHEVSTKLTDEPKDHNIDFYENQLLHPEKGREKISYHYIVDDKQIVNFVPDNEKCYHCGDGENGIGNSQSIGIERCAFEGIDHLKAIDMQAKLTAYLMKKYSIDIQNVVKHSYFRNTTTCPSRLSNGMFGGFDFFISRVKYFLNK